MATVQPTIVRIWRGRTRRDRAGNPTAVHHLERDAEFLIELPKNVQVLHLRTTHGNTGGSR